MNMKELDIFAVKLMHSDNGGAVVLPEAPLSKRQELALEVCLPALTAAPHFTAAEISSDGGYVCLRIRSSIIIGG
jgi:hypothetical protein